MLPLAARVGEAQVGVFDVIVLDRLQVILGGLHVVPSLISRKSFLGWDFWRDRRKSDRVRAGFAGPNPNRAFNARYKYLAIADPARLGRFADRFDGALDGL